MTLRRGLVNHDRLRFSFSVIYTTGLVAVRNTHLIGHDRSFSFASVLCCLWSAANCQSIILRKARQVFQRKKYGSPVYHKDKCYHVASSPGSLLGILCKYKIYCLNWISIFFSTRMWKQNVEKRTRTSTIVPRNTKFWKFPHKKNRRNAKIST